MRAVQLGVGTVGSDIAKRIAEENPDVDLIVADYRVAAAEAVAGPLNARAVQVDANDPASLAEVIDGADVVINAVGPFYKYGRTILQAVVDAGAHYVDICDEYDVTHDIFTDEALGKRVADAGRTVMMGCGATPGMSNVAGKWAIEQLDTAETIDMYLLVPHHPTLGATVNDHMLYALSGNVIEYLDGSMQQVPAWEGVEHKEMPEGIGAFDFGWFGHPEPITWALSYPDLQRSTIRFSWKPGEVNELWQLFNKLGLTHDQELPRLGVVPRQVLAHLMDDPAGQRMIEVDHGSSTLASAWMIEAKGTKDGRPATARAHTVMHYGDLAQSGGSMLTAWLAAEAATGILQGTITQRGVLAPEQVFPARETVERYAAYTGINVVLTPAD